ncbi:ATP-binding cassette domain-containing protein [Deinococcus malanensis]|uniref:ATP-binding cassette domain-containing protein n=1 Tax=Deinococcus malanensis TaxID=1706855 RepID=UPI00362B73F3
MRCWPGWAFPETWGISCRTCRGQRTRLSLARLSLTAAQLLILDEPTNHLDHAAIESVQGVLHAFEGTVIFASHDRHLVSEVASRYWWVEGGQMSDVTALEAEGTEHGESAGHERSEPTHR